MDILQTFRLYLTEREKSNSSKGDNMINTAMRDYSYFLLEDNSYGQQTIKKDKNGKPVAQGTIKLAINTTSQSVQDNINYSQATYIGLTHSPVTDAYVIQYGDRKLKVLYVNTLGRYNQVFMGDYNG